MSKLLSFQKNKKQAQKMDINKLIAKHISSPFPKPANRILSPAEIIKENLLLLTFAS